MNLVTVQFTVLLFLSLLTFIFILAVLHCTARVKASSFTSFIMHHFELDKEFNLRIKHNFKLYVLLTSKSMHWSEGAILDSIYRLKGYKRHKTVKYGQNTSHIHVKFEEEDLAKEAAELLNRMNCGLTAVLVDDMLRNWFIYEIKACSGLRFSLAVVDIMGNTPFNINFLTSNILNTIFQDFGAPYMLPYTAALNEPHVQVLFNSMTEALAACMAFGEWYHLEDKVDAFSYRVRINPSDKEENLIRNCGGMPSEAFKLDYFSSIKKELKTSRGNSSKTKENVSESKISLVKGSQKLHKQKGTLVSSSEMHQLKPMPHASPILYFPIITTSCYNAPASNNQLTVDFMTAILNCRQTFIPQAVLATNNFETEHDTRHQISEQNNNNKLEPVLSTPPNDSNRISQSYVCFDKSKKKRLQKNTRIFNRRT